MKYCDDCGSIIDRGHCTYCQEEIFIMEQHAEMGFSIYLGDDFLDKFNNQINKPK